MKRTKLTISFTLMTPILACYIMSMLLGVNCEPTNLITNGKIKAIMAAT